MATTPTVRRRTLPVVDALVLLGYAVLAVVVTRTWWAPLGGRVTSVNEPDAVLFSWLLTATPHALGEGRFPLYTDLLNHPDGVNLMWNNGMALPALLFAPVTGLFGGFGTVTVITTVGLAGTAAVAHGCLRSCAVAVGPAALGGLLAGFSPAMVAQAAGGHPNLVLNLLAPLLVLLAVRLLTAEQPSRRTAVLLGVTAGVQVLVGEEVLFLAGLVVALFLLVLVVSHPREVPRRAGPVARAAVLALAVFAVVGGPALAFQLAGPLPQTGSPFNTAYYAADLAGFVVGTPLQALTSEAAAARSAGFAGGLEERTALLGAPLLVGMLVALIVHRRDARVRTVLIVAACAALLSLGPQLVVDGVRTGIPLPWALIAGLPGFEHVIVTRLPLFTAGLLGAGLAFALDRLPPGPPALAGLALALAAFVPLVPVALPSRAAPEVPTFFTSGDPALRCPGGSVLVLPYPTAPETDAMAWQAAAGLDFAVPGGYFIGPAGNGRAYVGGLPSATGRLFHEVRTDGAVREPTAGMRAAFRADVERWGACAAVLGPHPQAPALLAQATALIGAEPEYTGGVAVWRDLTRLPR